MKFDKCLQNKVALLYSQGADDGQPMSGRMIARVVPYPFVEVFLVETLYPTFLLMIVDSSQCMASVCESLCEQVNETVTKMFWAFQKEKKARYKCTHFTI